MPIGHFGSSHLRVATKGQGSVTGLGFGFCMGTELILLVASAAFPALPWFWVLYTSASGSGVVDFAAAGRVAACDPVGSGAHRTLSCSSAHLGRLSEIFLLAISKIEC